jgi:hypothetical protein
MRIAKCLGAVGLLMIGICGVAQAQPSDVDLNQIAKAGTDSLRRMQTASASWTSINTLENGVKIEVADLRSSDRKERMIWSVEKDGQKQELMRLVIRDGFWYVSDARGAFKYRPYEAPASPAIYMAMTRCRPLFVRDLELLTRARQEGVEGNVAKFRNPIPAPLVKQLNATVEQLTAMSVKSGRPLTADTTKQIDFMKDIVANGMPIRIDISNGMIIEYGTIKLQTRIADFQFLKDVDEKEFDVTKQNWIERSSDPTLGDMNELVLIEHQAGLRPGQKGDTEGSLLDLSTGQVRRLPFPGPQAAGGCFLKDRRYVIVSGMDGDSVALRPYRIDLKTGECKALGGSTFETGFAMFPALSPDGNTIAISKMDPTFGLLKFQIYLVDLKTSAVKTVGAPLDGAFLNWTPDGNHLILTVRKTVEMNKPSEGSLALMDMHGTFSVLRRGVFSILLGDGKTLLFQDEDTRLWNTCDLDGSNVKLLGDGLKGYNFPAPAPDGKRIMMMHFVPGQLPEAVVMTIGESTGKVVSAPDGLWAMPHWR